MKLLIASLLILGTSFSFAAPGETDVNPDDLSTDADGNFVFCTLKDGRQMQATTWLVAVDNTILSKKPVRAYLTSTSENLEFKDVAYRVLVTKQFATAGGIQSIHIEHLKPTAPTENLECNEKNTP
ncbi:hypothetical protein B9G69_009495 [Bdellovibrio sp. SKB1291214]|uniref:hypothetical protein n=1 Tax=Bdellovibrio sp. SKB1291214 TaxID=1732569 RepID=UPI000B51C890|nr:hypothetical protein [Bdellovibrio sp. SKB1291214]UYL07279.1 hypothetical protein B9G69_009495 [Bdellovibrio sp. SKB1291214]